MSSDTAALGPIDLTTPHGRRRARRELVWGDHGFLRTRFRNLHRISDEMYRANQPSPEHIEGYAKDLGLKTIINLRGVSPKGYYVLEREACERNGIALVDFQVMSREAPTLEQVRGAKQLFESIAYPALMHCKSGADRAGVMSVLYQHFRKGQPISQAIHMLDSKYLHIKQGKTGVLDYFFETYLKEGAPLKEGEGGKSFEEWVATSYDPKALKSDFLRTWKSKWNLDQLLRRE
jgi:protein tyrosine/serine phosphatase